jgi:Flp pilus assembly pilin Flp
MNKNHLTCLSAGRILHAVRIDVKKPKVQLIETDREILTVNSIIKCYVGTRESLRGQVRGQTMTEYALILAAVAVVVYGAYAAMGKNIGSLANGVDSSLTNA